MPLSALFSTSYTEIKSKRIPLVGCVLLFFCFNGAVIHFHRLIRLTSPNLNYIIGTGAIIIYIVVFLTVIPVANQTLATVLCNLVPWLLAIGYSLCFGTIVAKMFRIYYIFNNPHSKKRVGGELYYNVVFSFFPQKFNFRASQIGYLH